jgi:hypothetical protein
MNQEYKFKTTGEMLTNFKPSYTITVGNADGEVGRLDFNGPKLIFTGDAEESAKVFVNYLTMIWDKRLQEEREAEREACAKVCEQEQFELTEDVAGKNGLQHFDAGCRCCAAAIRARGEA